MHDNAWYAHAQDKIREWLKANGVVDDNKRATRCAILMMTRYLRQARTHAPTHCGFLLTKQCRARMNVIIVVLLS